MDADCIFHRVERASPRLLTVAIAALVAILSLSVPVAQAADRTLAVSQRLTTIEAHADFGAMSSNWSSSGAVVDEGYVVPLEQELKFRGARWSFDERLLFVGQAGTFTISQRGRGIDVSPALSVGSSHWKVVSGTGAYADLRGHGQATLVFHWDAGTAGTLDVIAIGKLRNGAD